VVALTRDNPGYLFLDATMLFSSGDPRMPIQENFWIVWGDPLDVACPPHGRLASAD